MNCSKRSVCSQTWRRRRASCCRSCLPASRSSRNGGGSAGHRGVRQLKERVALKCELKPLDLPQTAGYMASRIRTAGGNPGKIFTREALTLIHGSSQGVPRMINVICRNALTSGFARERRRLDCEIVRDVCRDIDLRPVAKSLPAAAPLKLVEPAAHARE